MLANVSMCASISALNYPGLTYPSHVSHHTLNMNHFHVTVVFPVTVAVRKTVGGGKDEEECGAGRIGDGAAYCQGVRGGNKH